MNRPRLPQAWSIPTLAGLCLIVLLAAGLAVAVVGDRAAKAQLARAAGAQGDLLASAVSGALAFDDHAAAQDYVDAVQVNPNVLAAGIYDEDGRLVASFARPGQTLPRAAASEPRSTRFQGGRLYVVRPVEEGGQRLGTARLRLLDVPADQRFSRNAGLLLVLGLSALLLAVVALAQGALSRANRGLAARAEDLAAANAHLQDEMVERERAEEALRQSQKMEAIGRLTGGVAHDFNNLLMVVSSAIDLMQRTRDPARQGMLIEGVRQAVERGSGLTRQLLAFSRRAPLKSEVVDVGDRIEQMRILLERSLREDIEVRIEVRRPLPPIEVDLGELELAVLNLAVNARDAMPTGGRLTVTVRSEPGDGDGDRETVLIEVADTGSGIAPTLMSRIFEPFFTTKEVGKGTGLGLSQVYGFARSSGGEVEVRSEEGRGATFVIRLPASDKPLDAAPAPAAAAVPGHGRILLVEDDDAVASGVGHMLRDLGYTYVRACTGDEGLRLFGEDETFDLVLSDMVMPGHTGGLAMALELRRLHPDLPVVLSTGFSEAAANATANGFPLLSKPYGLVELAEVLAGKLGRPAH